MWPDPVLLTLHEAALLPISCPGPALLESEILTSKKEQPWRYKMYKVCGTYQLCCGEHTLPKERALKCGCTLQEAQVKRWRRPCGRLLDACQLLPHRLALLFPMYLLHLELCKCDKEELHNLKFYRLVICVHWPAKVILDEEREKYDPKQQGRETDWLHCSSSRLPISASLLLTILLSRLTVSGFTWTLHSPIAQSGQWEVLCSNHKNNQYLLFHLYFFFLSSLLWFPPLT